MGSREGPSRLAAAALACGALLLLCLAATDQGSTPPSSAPGRERAGPCEGARPTPPRTLFFTLRSSAFPGSPHPDAAVHIPPGFDATRSPGVVLYFHGWNGCVATALADEDSACEDGGDPRTSAALAAQIDDAHVNALLIAIELRPNAATGEPGDLAAPGMMRTMLAELLRERLAETIGCPLEVDALDRIAIIAHSGGYQGAASVLEFGDLPQVSEVVLLDALYGAEDVFRSWLRGGSPDAPPRRFVNIYTCCGGTADRSRAMAELAATEPGLVFYDDGDSELDASALAKPRVFKHVARAHSELPRAYVRLLLQNVGFARTDGR
jgi:hypothetical protein